VTERDVKRAADALVASGMRDAGYRYVIVDDCWYDPTRSANGSLRADPSTFPSGMRALGAYLHARGLRFGIYESPSQSTCAQVNGLYPGQTGSLGHERRDALKFARWGVDYLKYDWCSAGGTLRGQIAAFIRMRDALSATARPVVYSIDPNSFHAPTGASRDWRAIANLVRIGPDLAPLWDTGPLESLYLGIANAIAIDAPLWPRAGPGRWNDPDMLIVGLHAQRYVTTVAATGLGGLINPAPGSAVPSLEEMRTNFAMWAMMAAPLIVGCDLHRLSPEERRILLNRGLISIDQDSLGRQGRPVRADRRVWAKPLSNRAVAAALFNPSSVAVTIATHARQLGLPAAAGYAVLNLWTGTRSTTGGSLRARVPAHGVVVFRVTPVFKRHPHR
jgi:alpha-galactosidase